MAPLSMTSVRIASLLALVLLSPLAQACRAPLWDPLADLAGYEYIFSGDVVGVRLDGQIEAEMHVRRGSSIEHVDPQERRYGGINVMADSTLQHSIEVLPRSPIHGRPPLLIEISGGGCTQAEARIRAHGLFFVRADGTALVIYDDDPRFAGLEAHIRACLDAPCTQEAEPTTEP
jgi:hypothetical protein